MFDLGSKSEQRSKFSGSTAGGGKARDRSVSKERDTKEPGFKTTEGQSSCLLSPADVRESAAGGPLVCPRNRDVEVLNISHQPWGSCPLT